MPPGRHPETTKVYPPKAEDQDADSVRVSNVGAACPLPGRPGYWDGQGFVTVNLPLHPQGGEGRGEGGKIFEAVSKVGVQEARYNKYGMDST
jgi:hypothetical protein